MRKKKNVLLFAMLFVFVGCNHNEDYLVINPVEKEQRAIVDGKVPLSRAISNADFVFKNTEEFGCKAANLKVLMS